MFHNYFVFLAMTSTFEKLIFSRDQLLDLDACVSLLTDLQKTQMLDKKFTTEARNGPLLKYFRKISKTSKRSSSALTSECKKHKSSAETPEVLSTSSNLPEVPSPLIVPETSRNSSNLPEVPSPLIVPETSRNSSNLPEVHSPLIIPETSRNSSLLLEVPSPLIVPETSRNSSLLLEVPSPLIIPETPRYSSLLLEVPSPLIVPETLNHSSLLLDTFVEAKNGAWSEYCPPKPQLTKPDLYSQLLGRIHHDLNVLRNTHKKEVSNLNETIAELTKQNRVLTNCLLKISQAEKTDNNKKINRAAEDQIKNVICTQVPKICELYNRITDLGGNNK